MALTKDQKELIKWVVFVFTAVGIYAEGRVSKAKMQSEVVTKVEIIQEDVKEIKEDAKETREYTLENKDNITRVVTWIDLQPE